MLLPDAPKPTPLHLTSTPAPLPPPSQHTRTRAPQGLSNLAWAFATAQQPSPALFEAVARRALELGTDRFSAQNVSMMMWAFATTRHAAPELVGALLRRLEQEAPLCEGQNVANALWALARWVGARGAGGCGLCAVGCLL